MVLLLNGPKYVYYLSRPLSQSWMDKCIDRWKEWWLYNDFWWMNALMDDHELIHDECALVDK